MDSLYFDLFEPERPGSSDETDKDTQPWYDRWKVPCEDCKERGGGLCWRCNFVYRKREEEGCLFSPELVSSNLAFRDLLFRQARHFHSRDSPETSVTSIVDRRFDDKIHQRHDSITYRSENLCYESVGHRIWPGDLGDRDCFDQTHKKCEATGPAQLARTQAHHSSPANTPSSRAQQICMGCQYRHGCPEDLEHCTEHRHWCFPIHRDGCPRDFPSRSCHSCPEYPGRCQRDCSCDHFSPGHRDGYSKHSHSHYCHPDSKFPGIYSRDCYCSDCRTNVKKPEIDPLEEAFINWLSRRSEEPPPHIMSDCFRYSFNWHKSIKRRPNLVHYGIGLGGMSALSYGVGSCSPQPLPPHTPLRSRIWSMVSTSIVWGYEEGAKILGYDVELGKALRELD